MPQHHRHVTDRSADAIARLYVIWIGSTCLLLLVLVLVIFLLRGELSRQNGTIGALVTRIDEVEKQLAAQRDRPPRATTQAPPRESPSTTTRPATTTKPIANSALPAPAQNQPLDDAGVQRELARLLRLGELGRPELADRATAMALLARLERAAPPLQPPTLGRLALAALLAGNSDRAAAYAQQAESAGQAALDYLVESARLALDEGRAADARPAAARAHELSPSAECAIVFAAALADNVEYSAAGDVAESVQDWSALSPDDCMRLAGTFVELEWWPELSRLMPRIARLPSRLEFERERLRAIELIQHGSYADAASALELALGRRPNDAGAQRWRAIALLRSGQPDAARREFLALVERLPNERAARYWLGVLAQRAGNFDEARAYWQRCVDLAAGYAPAWEGLGLLSLNQNDLATATEQLGKAVAGDPRRASSQFLLGLCHAKAGRRGSAADALKAALDRDIAYLDEARSAEAIRRLFEPRELENLRGDLATQPARKNRAAKEDSK
ncbi:MAG: tetratricopeptide repeat protein [Phycisphaerales bacterium]|nr:tetratricopeptide repeat protein [Phycisphaerales bacterium]